MALTRSPTTRDLLVGLAATTVAEIEVLIAADRIGGPLAGHLLLNLLILPALAIRRTRPLGAALVAAVSMALQPVVGPAPVATGFLVLLAVLVSLGWYADMRRGVLGLAAVVAGGLVFDATSDDFLLADLVVNVVIIVSAWAAGRATRVASDRRVAAELEAERAAQVAVQEERARISRDLHDTLAHALTLITLQAGSTRERVDDAGLAATLGSIEHTGREALQDMHRFLRLLSAPAGDPPGIAHLDALAASLRGHGLAVQLDLSPEVRVPASVSTAVYRVVQEGLTNAVRHSDATEATVAVRTDAQQVVAVVRTTGSPRESPVPGSGRGLVGLRERLSAFGGSLDSSATADGWRLEARIPLPGVSR